MEVVNVLLMFVSAVTSLKCRTSVDVGIRWTVDCTGMDLTSAPPGMLIHPVIALNMSHNRLIHVQESLFTNWTDILILDLSSNSIQTIDQNAFKGLSSLTELYLNNNSIKVLSSNITNYLLKLKVLSITSNKLKEIEPAVFDLLPSLYKLYLSNNIELGSDPNKLSPLKMPLSKSVLTLAIENISLADIPKDLFGEASHLIYLNIALNPLRNITDLPVSLRYLNISGTLIETVSKDSFSNLHLVQKLSLESMPLLKEIKANSFSGLANIEQLFIKNCTKLSFISERVFSESHPKMKRVVLSHCALTTLPRSLQPLLDQTEYLDLRDNPWTCDSGVSWILNLNVANVTSELKCENPPEARGMLMEDYFKPRTLHPHTSLIRAAILVMLVAVLVASVVAMVKQMNKQKAKTYRQLNNIKLEDRTTRVLPSL
ncbi:leucine-rich repeat-containing protein 15-like [Macrosteles quadrilineatus]|uniref:leucine-rich repeat-containing protein 15-like n=1 Tax=Macrosteles quadrilineatus TaxID=74068 RepID=UPI0023E1DDE8|nr:leucine-rich repeat-containing protein 15-like [Macrosteles quadrilineatus]